MKGFIPQGEGHRIDRKVSLLKIFFDRFPFVKSDIDGQTLFDDSEI